MGCQLYQHPYLILVVSCQRSWSMLPCTPVGLCTFTCQNPRQFFGKAFSGTCAGSHHSTCRGWRFRFADKSKQIRVNPKWVSPDAVFQKHFPGGSCKKMAFSTPEKVCCLLWRVLSLPAMTFIPTSKVLRRSVFFAVRLYETAEIFFPSLPSPPQSPKNEPSWILHWLHFLSSLALARVTSTSQGFGYTLGDSWQREEKVSLS